METGELNAVTGAFGYTGKYITRRLLAQGKRVITLTGRPGRQNPFGAKVRAFPFNFERPAELARTLQGVTTLYNTYWVRFPRGETTYERAAASLLISKNPPTGRTLFSQWLDRHAKSLGTAYASELNRHYR